VSEQDLLSALLALAVWDWQRLPPDAEDTAHEMLYSDLETELRAFFDGDWCAECLDWIDCDYMDIPALLEKAGPPGDKAEGGARVDSVQER